LTVYTGFEYFRAGIRHARPDKATPMRRRGASKTGEAT
jgi:hypothetical protein